MLGNKDDYKRSLDMPKFKEGDRVRRTQKFIDIVTAVGSKNFSRNEVFEVVGYASGTLTPRIGIRDLQGKFCGVWNEDHFELDLIDKGFFQ